MKKIAPQFRFDAIDQLRGLVIVLMALDHVRDFVSPFAYSPEDLSQTSVSLFLTRWVTHFCAPVFVFLTGMSAFLFENKGISKRELRNFLLSRGIWLVFIELVVVNASWKFSFASWVFVQVIWVLGVSMLVLAALIYLPRTLTLSLGILMIAGHNLLDPILASRFGDYAWIWGMLHQPMWMPLGTGGSGVYFAYPLIPWIGVMAVGYASANWFLHQPQEFVRKCLMVGSGMTLAFILLRWSNWYGDPGVWETQTRGVSFTLLSFLNVQKYPPSLLYLLMTLGPALMILALMHQRQWFLSNPLTIFGRVPFFFYVLHLPVIHGLSILYFYLTINASAGWQIQGTSAFPQGYEPSLMVCYLFWSVVIVLMYFACRWFASIKQRHSHWLLRYL